MNQPQCTRLLQQRVKILKKKLGINNIIFTSKFNGVKRKGQQIKTEKIKQRQQQRKRHQKICLIPFVRLFISQPMGTETIDVEGQELYFSHQMQQRPFTKHSFQKLLRFRISVKLPFFFLSPKLILRYYNRFKIT